MTCRYDDAPPEWLAGLKVGDEVAIYSWGHIGTCPYRITTIASATPTLVRTKQDAFRRSDGNGRGSYNRSRIVQVTPEIREAIERRNLLFAVCNFKWSTLPTEKLRSIHALATDQP